MYTIFKNQIIKFINFLNRFYSFLNCLYNFLKAYFKFELKSVLFKIISYLAALFIYKDDFFLKLLKKTADLKIFKNYKYLSYWPASRTEKNKAVKFTYTVFLHYKKTRPVYITWEDLVKTKNKKQEEINKTHTDKSTFLFKPFNQTEPFYSTSWIFFPYLIFLFPFNFITWVTDNNKMFNSKKILVKFFLYLGAPHFKKKLVMPLYNKYFFKKNIKVGLISGTFRILHNYLYSFLSMYLQKPNFKILENLFTKTTKGAKIVLTKFYIFTYLLLFFKNCLIPCLVSSLIVYYSFFFFKLSFLKTASVWLLSGLLIFWLFSTFNFFIKRYRFSKYTSAIQRFWKRAFMCFWVIEGFLFMILVYYLLNASGEPLFMYDIYALYIFNLVPFKDFIISSFLIVILLNLFVYLLINLKSTTLKKNMYLLLFITSILFYLFFVELYQVYYLLNFYTEYTWIYSEDDNVWELEYDIPRTRNKNHYLSLIIVGKFWHYIFIITSWIFFLMKTLETKRLRYSILSMSFQNLILFYIMSWICLYSWVKFVLRRFMDQSFYWFFISFRDNSMNSILNDLFLYFWFGLLKAPSFFKKTINLEFYYFNLKSYQIFSTSTIFYTMNSKDFLSA